MAVGDEARTMHCFTHVWAAVGGVSSHDPDRIVLEVGRDDALPFVFQNASRRLRLGHGKTGHPPGNGACDRQYLAN